MAGQISTIPFGPGESVSRGRIEPVDWYAAGLGPRFRRNGQLMEHSILGDPENFYQMAVCRGDIPLDVSRKNVAVIFLYRQYITA